MEFNLLPVINAEGKKLKLDAEIDFSAQKENGVVFLSPVSVSGEFENVGGDIELKAVAHIKLRHTCDRCCEEYESELSFEINEVLKEYAPRDDADKNPDVIYFKGNSVELDEIVKENLFLSLPLKNVCSESCKGLCPECGANLNLGSCGCDTRATDPRFDALDKFFK